jgi:hypothetical protein
MPMRGNMMGGALGGLAQPMGGMQAGGAPPDMQGRLAQLQQMYGAGRAPQPMMGAALGGAPQGGQLPAQMAQWAQMARNRAQAAGAPVQGGMPAQMAQYQQARGGGQPMMPRSIGTGWGG